MGIVDKVYIGWLNRIAFSSVGREVSLGKKCDRTRVFGQIL